MKRFILGGLVVALLLCLVMESVWARGWPITGSQVITLEHGPDGYWLSQAWAVEWQARADLRLALVYDTWRVSAPGAPDWVLAYRQVDLSATWQTTLLRSLPLAITAGYRAKWPDGASLGDSGPGLRYAMFMFGWQQ